MDLNKLNTFYTLARTKNYSKCAERLFVTQSAVSHAIKALEQSIGLALTEKRKNGFALTPEGEVLFKSCRSIFTEVDRARERLSDRQSIPEVIRLGAPVEFGINVVVRHMAPFLDAHPRLHVDFTLSHRLLSPLLEDELDLIIDCRPHNRPGLVQIPLLREDYVVVASPAYIAAHGIDSVGDLEHCNLISLDKEMGWWQNFIQALPPEPPVRFGRVTRINHIRGIIEACLASVGVGFVPRYAVAADLETGRLVPLFPHVDVLRDQIGIYYKKRVAARPSVAALTGHLQEIRF
ncbi:MAG: LysR family transcriptional regulator [Desulfobacter sp.]|nr:MAG: LysR family transcriptional regulator [Desulfobacter sp.]